MRLSAKLILAIASVATTTTVVASVIIYAGFSQNIKRTTAISQEEAAKASLEKINRFVDERITSLQNISRAEQIHTLISGKTAPQTVESDLSPIANYKHFWHNLSVINLKGKTLAITSKDDESTAPSTDATANVFDKARAGKVAYSDFVQLEDHDEPSFIIMVPIHNRSGQQIGVMAGEIDWEAINDIVKLNKQGTSILINKDGTEIVSNLSNSEQRALRTKHQDSVIVKQAQKNRSGSLEAPGLTDSNETVLASYATETGFGQYGGNDWRLIISQSKATALAPAKNLTVSLLWIMLLLSAIVCALITWLAHRFITLPIRRLSMAIQNISLGNLAERVEIHGNDELSQLANTFNTVTSQLATTTVNLQQEKTRLESSINSLPLGFMLTDANVDIITFNPIMNALLNLKNKPPKLDKGKRQPANITFLQELLGHCQTTLAKRQAYHIPEQSFNNRIYRIFFSPVTQEDEAIGVAVLIEDITEAKLLDRSKDEFFSIASHELRTPLTAIRGNTSLIQQYYGESLKDKDLKELVGDIHESSLRLIDIVNDFLDASRLEQGKMKLTFEQFDLQPVIESVIYELGSISREKKIYIKTENTLGTMPQVYADKNRVKQIIYNLTGNAIRFTEKGGITIKPEIQGDHLKICVTDTGGGISAENQQLLFHKFQQASDSILTRDTTRGTGLGLYICRLLLGQMDGEIKLESSTIGKGTTFSFTLPLNPPKNTPKNDPKPTATEKNKPAAA